MDLCTSPRKVQLIFQSYTLPYINQHLGKLWLAKGWIIALTLVKHRTIHRSMHIGILEGGAVWRTTRTGFFETEERLESSQIAHTCLFQ